MRRPGDWLRATAARLCARQTLERVIDPVIADLQAEYEEALRSGHRRHAVVIRVLGYLAFWRTVGLHLLETGPRTLWNPLAAYSLLLCVAITLLLSTQPMIATYSRFSSLELTVLLLPQAVPISIPIALSLAIAWNMDRTRVRAGGIRTIVGVAMVGTLIAFAAMLTIPVANQAFRVAMAEQLESHGITEYSFSRGINELSLSELSAKSTHYDANGSTEAAARVRRSYHFRFAFPAATLVLSLLALCISAIAERRAARVVALVGGFGAYYATLMLVESKPLLAMLSPVISAWAPNVLFAAVSLSLLNSRAATKVAI